MHKIEIAYSQILLYFTFNSYFAKHTNNRKYKTSIRFAQFNIKN